MNCSVTTAALIDCAEFKTLGERTVSFLIFWCMSEFAKEWDKKCNSRKPRESPRRRLRKIKRLRMSSHFNAIHSRNRGLLPVKIQPFAELKFFKRKNFNKTDQRSLEEVERLFRGAFQQTFLHLKKPLTKAGRHTNGWQCHLHNPQKREER